MAVINRVAEFEPEIRGWRRHLHTIPELDFDLFETADFVAERLREFGVDAVHAGIAKTGMVALIHGRAPGPTVGLRADMDALPIGEATGPAVEVAAAGADARLRPRRPHRDPARRRPLPRRDPQLRRHRRADLPAVGGDVGRGAGDGRGGHSRPLRQSAGLRAPQRAEPAARRVRPARRRLPRRRRRLHPRRSPAAAATRPRRTSASTRSPALLQIGQGLLAIPAREVDPLARAVVSLTVLAAGEAENVIPETARARRHRAHPRRGGARQIAAAIERLVAATARAYGVAAELDYRIGYPVLVNEPRETAFCAEVAAEVVGPARVDRERPPEMGAEDFAYMLNARPGAYVFLGTGAGRRPPPARLRLQRRGDADRRFPTSCGWSSGRCRSLDTARHLTNGVA